MRNKQILKLVFCSLLGALLIVMVLTGIGYIPLAGTVYITILTIPVFIGAIFLGKWYGLILGVVFGLTSMIYSIFIPGSIGENAPFTNPLLSVLPRAFFGFIINPIYLGFKKNIKRDWICVFLTVLFCQLIHSFSVLTILYYVGKEGYYLNSDVYPYANHSELLTFLMASFGFNGLIEIFASLSTVLPISIALKHVVVKEEIEEFEEVNDDNIDENNYDIEENNYDIEENNYDIEGFIDNIEKDNEDIEGFIDNIEKDNNIEDVHNDIEKDNEDIEEK